MTVPGQPELVQGHDARLEIRLLGTFQVLVGDASEPLAAWTQGKVSALIKLLALAPGCRLHREQVMETLWPELGARAAANNLRVLLHQARRALRSTGIPCDRILTREGGQIVLASPEHLWVDVAAFEQAAEQAWRRGDPGTFYQAIDLYRGDLLADDLYDEWLAARRDRLRGSFLSLLAGVATLEEERGIPAQAVAALECLLASEPSEEEAARRLMRLLAEAGRRKEALAIYDQFRVALAQELDADPEASTLELVAAIRKGRLALQPSDDLDARAATDRPPPTNLAVELGRLIDREEEIASVGELLDTARLVTLTGAGGIGKTRLARAIGARMLQAYPSGVFVVELASVHQPDGLMAAIARALGVRASRGQSVAGGVVDYLRARKALLILDNFEHLLPIGRLVSELLGTCPDLEMLVTSRERLNLRGEQVYHVLPLRPPGPREGSCAAELGGCPPVELFIERARAAQPEFELTDDNAAAVAEICRRLDGLPLAIELAAARVTVLTPAAMLPRLDRSLSLLTGGFRDLPARQRTMRDTIAWSHDQLGPEERLLFRRLAIFTGGWTVASAEAVFEPERDAASVLASLLDKSLIMAGGQVAGEPRFGMLETVREFGLEQLAASGETGRARALQAGHVVALVDAAAPNLSSDAAALWLDRLEADYGNIRSALDWMLETGAVKRGLRLASNLRFFWFHRGSLTEGIETSNAFLNLDNASQPTIHRAAALDALGMLHLWHGEYAPALQRLSTARSIYQRRGCTERLPAVLNALGMASYALGDSPGAQRRWVESLESARQVGNLGQQASALRWLATMLAVEGSSDDARAMLAESLQLFRAAGNMPNASLALQSLGDLALHRSDYQDAAGHYRESLELWRQLGSNWGIVCGVERTSVLALAIGDHNSSVRLARAAQGARRRLGLPMPPDERAELDRLTAAVAAGSPAGGVSRGPAVDEVTMPLDEMIEAALAVCQGRTLDNVEALISRQELWWPDAGWN